MGVKDKYLLIGLFLLLVIPLVLGNNKEILRTDYINLNNTYSEYYSMCDIRYYQQMGFKTCYLLNLSKNEKVDYEEMYSKDKSRFMIPVEVILLSSDVMNHSKKDLENLIIFTRENNLSIIVRSNNIVGFKEDLK